jgi:hypothetical protein
MDSISDSIEEALTYPSSEYPIPNHMKAAAVLRGGRYKRSVYPFDECDWPYMWVVPSARLQCDSCGYYPWADDRGLFKPGDKCPGKGWKKEVKSAKDLFDLGKDSRPTCMAKGTLVQMHVLGDIFKGNFKFWDIVNECNIGLNWKEAGGDKGDMIGEIFWNKWFTIEGAMKRVPHQLKGHINVNRIHHSGKSEAERQTSLY